MSSSTLLNLLEVGENKYKPDLREKVKDLIGIICVAIIFQIIMEWVFVLITIDLKIFKLMLRWYRFEKFKYMLITLKDNPYWPSVKQIDVLSAHDTQNA